MDHIEEFSEDQWNELVLSVSKQFKVTADFDFILFIIGMHERGLGFRHYSREEKWDLLNLGKCTLFELLGFLRQSGKDDQDWPAFEVLKNVNTLTPTLQKHLLKRAMIHYLNKVMHH
jgi:hypothetical protein